MIEVRDSETIRRRLGGREDLRPTGSAVDCFHRSAVEALTRRVGIDADKPVSAEARDLENATLLDLAGQSLRLQGHNPATMPPADRAEMALMASDPMNSPGSFPNVLSAAANKIAERPADDAAVTFRQWSYRARKSPPDFKPTTVLHIGEFAEFPEHIDGHPFEQSTFNVETNWFQIGSYGDEFALTPRMIVDDDLDIFADSIEDKATAHDLTLQRLCVELLTKNVTLPDTYPLFHTAQHGNDLAAGAAPAEAQLTAIRQLLRQQQGVSQQRVMGYDLFGILIPSQLETNAEKILSDLHVVPAVAANAEIYRGRVRYWTEPMLDGYSTAVWYGFADPQRARAIVHAHQQGFEKMKLRQYVDPRTTSLTWQCEGRFAAAVRNYRGVVRNPGA